MKLYLGLALLFAGTISLAANNGYEIKIKVKGLPADSTCYLAHYYGEGNSVKDTVKSGKNGWVVFSGKKTLPEGIYLFVTHKRYFEFVVTNQQHFTMETDTTNFVKYLKVSGNDETKLFYEYLNYSGKLYEKSASYANAINRLRGRLTPKDKDGKPITPDKQDEMAINDSIAYYRKKANEADSGMKKYKTELINTHPGYFITKVFQYNQDPEVPEAPILPNGRKDSTFAYRYFRAHYFDNMDFKDERMIRTPIFANKLKFWMDQMQVQVPDSLNKACDEWIDHARANKELFKYSLAWLAYHYEVSKTMGLEAVFVHLVNKYYVTGQATWVDSVSLFKMINRAHTMEPVLIGKRPENFMLEDTLGMARALLENPAKYTVLFLYDPDCGHCRKSTPILRDDMAKLKGKVNVKVVAVSIESETDKWKKFIREFNVGDWVNLGDPNRHSNFRAYFDVALTPVIYILNEKNEIIARRISAEQVKEIIENTEKAEEERRKKKQ